LSSIFLTEGLKGEHCREGLQRMWRLGRGK